MKDEKEKTTIVILHGWGLKGSIYSKLSDLLKNEGYKVFAPDMPGFGKEPLVNKSMNLNDYVLFVKNFLEKKKLKKVILIGHSFGGRVSIKFSARFPQSVHAIVLTGVPGIRQKLSFFRKIIQYFAVSIGEVFKIKALLPVKHILRKGLYFMIGEWDYYNAGDLRETFKNVINEDLSFILSRIGAKTLLVWGSKDSVVPSYIGESMQRQIKNSELILIKGEGHKLLYTNPKKFADAILSFIKTI